MALLFLFFCLFGIGAGSEIKDAYDSAKTTMEETSKFLDKAGKVADKLSLFDTVVMYATAGGYAASSAKQLFDLVMLLGPGKAESPELKFMKEQFNLINTKLDALDYEFESVRHLIDWNVVRVNLADYESRIASLELQLKLVMTASGEVRTTLQDMFVRSFQREFANAPEKIYMAMTAKTSGSIFQENALEAARHMFNNDLVLVTRTAGLMMRSIQRGLTLHGAFLSLRNDTEAFQELQEQWQGHFTEIKRVAKQVEKKIIDSWPEQYRKDADKYLVKFATTLDNAFLSKGLHSLLEKKYPNRNWFVLVYTFDEQSDTDRFYDNCGEMAKINVGGKVAIINSRDTKTQMLRYFYRWIFLKVYSFMGIYGPNTDVAKKLFQMPDHFKCDFFRFKGVIESDARPVVTTTQPHLRRVTSVLRWFHFSKFYDLIAF